MSGISAAVIASSVDHVLVELHWVDTTRDGDDPERLWQLLTVRDGLILAMQGFGKIARERSGRCNSARCVKRKWG